MIYEESHRLKKIVDPLFSSVKKYLETRLSIIIDQGDEERIKVAKQRYQNLKHSDLQIEPSVRYDNGKLRSCVVSRSRDFFHADAVIEQVDFDTILTDLDFKVSNEFTSETILTAIKKDGLNSGVYYLTDTDEKVLVISKDKSTVEAVYKLLGSIHWYEMTLAINEHKDPVTERSGTVLVRSINMEDKLIPIYYKPHIQE